MVSVVISPVSFLIVFIWILSLFFLMSLLNGLSILFIFSKNQLLDLLILTIVLLVCMLFYSALILVISFLLLVLGCLVVPPVLVDLGLGCVFEMFLTFLGRPILLWSSLSGLPFLCPVSFRLLWVHFLLFPESFWFLPYCHSWPIHCLIACCSISMSLSVFEFFPWGWFLVSVPCGQRKCLYDFNFLEFVEACFVSYHVIYLWKHSMCIWKECVVCFFGMKDYMYQLVHFI